jgi:hypothetical protein
MELLKGEFFQAARIVVRMLEQIENALPIFTQDYSGIKVYLGVIRFHFTELENFGLDCSEEGSAPRVLISRTIINKLPIPFKQVLIEHTRNAFPSLIDLH